ncbi:hypothetical protein [Actinomycetospora aeridis]|uniref:Uncharacterized protein n=1 Tax=Actinomycetospora aeridis TaxID=3129231 RepID=A0ABU8N9I8_9PSEU
MSTPGGGAEGADAGRAAQERLTEEARATASALIDWLGTRVEATSTGAGGGPAGGSRRTTAGHSRLGMRPPQSPGPCAWCPICALVAALRGEQPELTARLAEQASGLMTLLRLMVQTHQDPGHHTSHEHHAPPAGGPAEWGAWDGWGAASPDASAPGDAAGPADAPECDAAPGSRPGAEDTPATPAASRPRRPAGPAGRGRVPIRRASPRSATFRDTPAPAAAATPSPTTGPTSSPTPSPTPAPAGTTDGPQAAPTGSAGSPARPSVQRIAIRRPERPARPSGTPGPDAAGGAAPPP